MSMSMSMDLEQAAAERLMEHANEAVLTICKEIHEAYEAKGKPEGYPTTGLPLLTDTTVGMAFLTAVLAACGYESLDVIVRTFIDTHPEED